MRLEKRKTGGDRLEGEREREGQTGEKRNTERKRLEKRDWRRERDRCTVWRCGLCRARR